jgi:ATP-dependent protease ClpP protease subunit
MLLNREIGQDMGMIDAALFQEELMELDNMGKKRIQVWINSPGGLVLDSYNIYNAILKSKTPVDTYNVGIAASMAGAIFMAGRKRYMADYARLMMHPVANSNDSKTYSTLMDSISTMLCSKSNCSEDDVKFMMSTTTWLTASQAFEKGFCTEIENTSTSNSKYAKYNETALWEAANSLILTTTNPNKMKKVANLLSLNEDANETSIESAVNKLIQEKAAAVEATNTAIADKTALEAQLTEAKNNVTAIQAQLDAANATANEAVLMVAENNAKALVDSYAPRIGTKPEVVSMWTNLAKNDMEGTKAMLEALPVNVAGAKVTTGQAQASGSAQAVMIEIQNRLNKKA